MTKDGIPLQIKCRFIYQIEPKSETDKRPASRFPGGAATTEVLGAPEYPVYEDTVRKAVLTTAEEGWKGLFPWGPIGELRDVAATYTLDQFNDPATRVLKAIEEEVVRRYQPEASKYGVYFREFDILGVEMPEDVRQQMLRRWTAPLEGRIRVQEAEAERDAMIARSEARARSLEQLGSAQLALSDGVITIFQKLMETLPQIESERLALGFLSAVQELAGRIGRDETDALRVIRAMRTLTEGPIPKGWVITSPTSSVGIPPGSTSAIPAQLDATEETEEAKSEEK